MNYSSSIEDKLAVTKMISWIVFDDRFFIYDPDQSLFTSHPISIFSTESDSSPQVSKKINLIVDTPFQLVPESNFQDENKSILIQSVYPYLDIADRRIKIDTWTNQYAKCVYYLPQAFQNIKALRFNHWMTGIEKYSQRYLDKVHSALICIRIFDTLYVLLQINKSLKEAISLRVPSPDDSSYHILKLVEKYKSHQEDLTIITNETHPSHIGILKKFLPEIVLIQEDTDKIIPAIIDALCE